MCHYIGVSVFCSRRLYHDFQGNLSFQSTEKLRKATLLCSTKNLESKKIMEQRERGRKEGGDGGREGEREGGRDYHVFLSKI